MWFVQDLLSTSFRASSNPTAILTLLCTLAVALVFRQLWPVVQLYIKSRRLPGPGALQASVTLWGVRGSGHELFKMLNNWVETYGKLYQFWVVKNPWVVIVDPNDVQTILLHPKLLNHPSHFTEGFVGVFDNGLLIYRDDKWKHHRKGINRMFRHSILKKFLHVFDHKAQDISDKLSEISDGAAFDILQFTCLYALDAICGTVIGVDMSTAQDRLTDYAKATKAADDLIVNWFSQPLLRFRSLHMLFTTGRETARIKKEMSDFIQLIVRKRMGEYQDKRRHQSAIGVSREEDCVPLDYDEDEVKSKDKRGSSILDLMIIESETGNKRFTYNEINGELQIMASAGFITTALTLSHLLLLLGIHGDIQDEIARELDEVFGSDTRPATADDLSRLRSLDRALKETLRLFPAAPFIPREISEDTNLPSGHTLPAGTEAVIYLYMLHRDARYFPDPESFNPDRWLPGNSADIHPYAYIPFGAGQRNCIGYKYATMQMKVAASCLLRRFRVSTRTTMEDLMKSVNVSVTLKCDVGYNVQLFKK